MKVACLEPSSAWLEALSRFEAHDVYHLPNYNRAAADSLGGKAVGFLVTSGDQALFHPIVLRPIHSVGLVPITEELLDAQTAPGYGGPLARGSTEFLRRAWAAYDDWCAERLVVTELIRFSPFLRNDQWRPPRQSPCHSTPVLAVPLSGDATVDPLEPHSTRQHRQHVRSAIARGLTARPVSFREHVSDLAADHLATMQRVGAPEDLHYSDSYFGQLAERPETLVLLQAVTSDSTPVAYLLLLGGRDVLHTHISTRYDGPTRPGATNLLIQVAAEYAGAASYSWLNLGGGRGGQRDSLWTFKSQVSRYSMSFVTLRRVLDRSRYVDLVGLWRSQYGEPPAGYLQSYRLSGEARPAASARRDGPTTAEICP